MDVNQSCNFSQPDEISQSYCLVRAKFQVTVALRPLIIMKIAKRVMSHPIKAQ